MRNKKSDDQLIRFSWKRNPEYDLSLLLEVQKRNPYSFDKPKPIWEMVAKSLQELKMRVTERGCRDRVNELLKKHRKEEGQIIRSTGAVDDEITQLKKLLISVNEMSLTKPDKSQASLHKKKAEVGGASIRNAALDNISDSDSDDYISGKFPRSVKNASKRAASPLSEEVVTGVNGFFRDGGNISSEGEHRLMQEGLSDEELLFSDVRTDTSWMDEISTLDQNQYSVSPQPSQFGNDLDTSNVTTEPTSSSVILSPINTISIPSSSLPTVVVTSPKQPPSSNRFSNPKKDLINYLERKSEYETAVRREEIRVKELERKDEFRIREMEVTNKKDELQILRLKTEAEIEEKKKSLELDAIVKRQEMEILRLRTEAETDERKKMQEFMIAIITKNNP